MKLVKLCLSTRKSRESSFHHCGSPVKLVQKTCLSTRKELESCFHTFGGPVKLVQACVCGGIDQAVLTSEEVL